ncbi:MAG: hypothetical protein ABIL23_03290, partial [candidate division WOR-3 bacterium]
MEILIVLGERFWLLYGDKQKGDSITLQILKDLADMGYPLAKADVYFNEREYIAVLDKGKFVVFKNPLVIGDFKGENVLWMFKGLSGKPFNYSEIISMQPLASFYNLKFDVFRENQRVVFKFSTLSNSEVRFNIFGNGGIIGDVDLYVYNIFSTPMKVGISGQFDSTRAYSEGELDIPENAYIPIGIFSEFNLYTENGQVMYYGGVHRWFGKSNLGFGIGEFYKPLGILRYINLKPEVITKVFMGYGDVGVEVFGKLGIVSVKGFKGFWGLKKPYGGFDGYREVPILNSLADNFLVI